MFFAISEDFWTLRFFHPGDRHRDETQRHRDETQRQRQRPMETATNGKTGGLGGGRQSQRRGNRRDSGSKQGGGEKRRGEDLEQR
jgi:hypothetical protein